MTKIYQFKVKGYTTILYGKKCNIRNGFKKDSYYYGGYYVQRGDGTKYGYEDYRIEWAKEICEVGETDRPCDVGFATDKLIASVNARKEEALKNWLAKYGYSVNDLYAKCCSIKAVQMVNDRNRTVYALFNMESEKVAGLEEIITNPREIIKPDEDTNSIEMSVEYKEVAE